jgi:hypothetical protein
MRMSGWNGSRRARRRYVVALMSAAVVVTGPVAVGTVDAPPVLASTPVVVTGSQPASGPTAGGTVVTITGSGFTGVSAVDFGTVAAPVVTVNSATSITAVAPAATAGPVYVTVTGQGHKSAISSAGRFTYVAPVGKAGWSAPTPIDEGGSYLTSVSCVTATFCAAVDGSGFALTYNGTKWSTPVALDPSDGLGSVSCATTTFCVASGDDGNVYTYGSGTWFVHDGVDTATVTSVACPQSTFCVAVDSRGNALTSTDGTTWVVHPGIDPNGYFSPDLNAVTCLTGTTSCTAVDANGLALTTTDGVTWAPTTVHAGSFLLTVGCATTTLCFATDDEGGQYQWDGVGWFPATIDPDGPFTSVSCPTTDFCVAVDAAGNAVFSGDGGNTWSVTPIDETQGGNGNLGGLLRSVSCPSTTFCVAVDANGNAFIFSGGVGWSTATPAAVIDPTTPQELTSVSCVTVQFCAAVDDSNYNAIGGGGSDGNVVNYNGSGWSVHNPPIDFGTDQFSVDITSVSCPTTLFCVAVDSRGRALTTTNGGANWSAPDLIDPYPGPPRDFGLRLTAVSCANASFCVAVDDEGDSLVTSDGGQTWSSASPTPQTLTSVSCPVAGFCVGVGGANAYSTDDGITWVAYSGSGAGAGVDPDNDLESVSCPTAVLCVAVDSQGDALTYLAGFGWSAPGQIDTSGSGLTSVSCATGTTSCAAVDGGGNAFTTSDARSWSIDRNADPNGLESVSCATATFCVAVDSDGEAVTLAGSWISIVPYPVQAVVGVALNTTTAFFTYHPAPGVSVPAASKFTATIAWGDGSDVRSPVMAAPLSLDAGGQSFEVQGTHTYTGTGPTSVTITVTAPAIATSGPLSAPVSATATGTLALSLQAPQASFFANPPDPSQNGIALFVPQEPGPDQRGIVEYQWTFLDDGGFTVIDDAQNDKVIDATLAALAIDPGDSDLRTQAITLGILPNDAAGGPLGLGGWTSAQVTQLVGVWQAYFPYHIVPHAFDYYGNVGVGLVTTDSKGDTSQYTQNYPIARDCQPWGGPLSSWFGGYTTCDTYNGIATQFGPHRGPDYVTFSISNQLGSGTLGFGDGASLTIVAPVAPTDQPVVLIGAQLSAGVDVGSGGAVQWGWLGPPDPADQPVSQSDVVSFVSGSDLGAGLGVQVLNFGLGFTALVSLTSHYPSGERLAGQPMAGEEIAATVGNTPKYGVSGSAGDILTCSQTLPTVGAQIEQAAKSLYNTWSSSSNGTSQSLASSLASFLKLLAGSGIDVGAAVVRAIGSCVGWS